MVLLPAVVLAEPEVAGAPARLTLDPAGYAEALRAVHGLPQPPTQRAATEGAEAPVGQPEGAPAPAEAADAEGAEAPRGAAASPEALPAVEGRLAAAPGVEDWQAAMRDAGTELAEVRLLVLLQRLNPLEPPATRAEDYAEVLRLHHLMLAGNARACLLLARACREGRFENGLQFIQSEGLAALLERRSAVFVVPAQAAQ